MALRVCYQYKKLFLDIICNGYSLEQTQTLFQKFVFVHMYICMCTFSCVNTGEPCGGQRTPWGSVLTVHFDQDRDSSHLSCVYQASCLYQNLLEFACFVFHVTRVWGLQLCTESSPQLTVLCVRKIWVILRSCLSFFALSIIDKALSIRINQSCFWFCVAIQESLRQIYGPPSGKLYFLWSAFSEFILLQASVILLHP